MTSAGSIVARDDTLLGVCFALGEDFGFNPVYLRVLLALIVLWSLPTAIGVYAALGLPVAVSRRLAPDPVRTKAVEEASERGHEPLQELPLAA